MNWFRRKIVPAQEQAQTPEKVQQEWRHGVVGNITKTHYDEQGIVRYGSKAFCGGTRVYLSGKHWQKDWGDICVIGLNRYKRWVFEEVPAELIENVRYTKIYKPSILNLMQTLTLMEGFQWWGRSAQDKREALQFVEAWNRHRS